jgi:hypothetical protein
MANKRFIIEYELDLIKKKQAEDSALRGPQHGGHPYDRYLPSMSTGPLLNHSSSPSAVLKPKQLSPLVVSTKHKTGSPKHSLGARYPDPDDIECKVRQFQSITRKSSSHLQDMLDKFELPPDFTHSPSVIPPAHFESSTRKTSMLRSSFDTSTTNLPMTRVLTDQPLDQAVTSTLSLEEVYPSSRSFYKAIKGLERDIRIYEDEKILPLHHPNHHHPHWNNNTAILLYSTTCHYHHMTAATTTV